MCQKLYLSKIKLEMHYLQLSGKEQKLAISIHVHVGFKGNTGLMKLGELGNKGVSCREWL